MWPEQNCEEIPYKVPVCQLKGTHRLSSFRNSYTSCSISIHQQRAICNAKSQLVRHENWWHGWIRGMRMRCLAHRMLCIPSREDWSTLHWSELKCHQHLEIITWKSATLGYSVEPGIVSDIETPRLTTVSKKTSPFGQTGFISVTPKCFKRHHKIEDCRKQKHIMTTFGNSQNSKSTTTVMQPHSSQMQTGPSGPNSDSRDLTFEKNFWEPLNLLKCNLNVVWAFFARGYLGFRCLHKSKDAWKKRVVGGFLYFGVGSCGSRGAGHDHPGIGNSSQWNWFLRAGSPGSKGSVPGAARIASKGSQAQVPHCPVLRGEGRQSLPQCGECEPTR